jgi:hypothetical protein
VYIPAVNNLWLCKQQMFLGNGRSKQKRNSVVEYKQPTWSRVQWRGRDGISDLVENCYRWGMDMVREPKGRRTSAVGSLEVCTEQRLVKKRLLTIVHVMCSHALYIKESNKFRYQSKSVCSHITVCITRHLVSEAVGLENALDSHAIHVAIFKSSLTSIMLYWLY